SENLYIEEANEETSHFKLLRNLGRAADMSDEEIEHPQPLPSTAVAMAAWEGLTKSRPWLEGLAAKAVLERFNDPASGVKPGSKAMMDVLRARFGLTGEALGFHEVHAVADLEHGSMGYELIHRHIDDGTTTIDRVATAARTSAEAFRLMTDGWVEHCRAQKKRS
ncbi:MAG: iron-containing redox enzyme family protein, partial [Dehalococcoidia bacterium]